VNHNLEINDFIIDEIVSIEFLGEDETIDIDVEGTHMFFANDIYTHNSALGNTVVTLDSISEAFSKTFIADLVLTVARPMEGVDTNKGNILIAKNRMGPDGFVMPFLIDTKTSTIKVFSPTVYTTQSAIEENEKRQAKNIAEAYKEYKRSSKVSDKSLTQEALNNINID